jgi:phage shock protein A
MKKLFLVIILYLLSSSHGMANSCLDAMKQLDDAIAETKQLTREEAKEIKSLKEQAKEAYKEGNKEDCQKLISEALDLLG